MAIVRPTGGGQAVRSETFQVFCNSGGYRCVYFLFAYCWNSFRRSLRSDAHASANHCRSRSNGRCLLANFTTFPVTTGPEPTSITAGPNGSLWFAQPGSLSSNVTPSYIGSISTSGSISEFELPAADEATSLTAGSDGNIWFTDPLNLAIGQITTSGQVQEFKLPAAASINSSNGIITLGGITEGPDGNVWFDGPTLGGGQFSLEGNLGIGQITPAGQIAEFAVSGTFLGLAGTKALITNTGTSLAFGQDNDLPSGSVSSTVGTFTTSGTASLAAFSDSSESRVITGITADAEGDVWFPEVITTEGFFGSGGATTLEIGELNKAGLSPSRRF